MNKDLIVRASLGRRTLSAAIVLVTALTSILNFVSSSASIVGEFCQGPESMRIMGSIPQSPLHVNHFIDSYEKKCSAALNKINYDPVGDAAAVEAVVRHRAGLDLEPYLLFATDLPLTHVERWSAEMDIYNPFRPAPLSYINHFPAYAYAISVGYNLGYCDSSNPLKLNSRTLSLIYSGVITTWNHPLITIGDPNSTADDNPWLMSCGLTIKPSVRDDESTTSIVFKDYLSQQNALFVPYKTKELSRAWPTTLSNPCRALSDGGMTTCLDSSGTIAYVPFQEAIQRSYKMAHIANGSGNYVGPSSAPLSTPRWPDQCQVAANAAAVPISTNGPTTDWSRVTMANVNDGYPLCGFAYLLGYRRPNQAHLGSIPSQSIRTMVDYLTMVVDDETQEGLKVFNVAPLPNRVKALVRTGTNDITN